MEEMRSVRIQGCDPVVQKPEANVLIAIWCAWPVERQKNCAVIRIGLIALAEICIASWIVQIQTRSVCLSHWRGVNEWLRFVGERWSRVQSCGHDQTVCCNSSKQPEKQCLIAVPSHRWYRATSRKVC